MSTRLLAAYLLLGLLSGCQRLPLVPHDVPPVQEAPAGVSVQGTAVPGWVEGAIWGVRSEDTGLTVLFLNTYSQPDGLAPGVWHQIDVTMLGVPADALAVLVSGILIITHGWTPETCNLVLAFRAPGGTTLAGNYVFQAIEASIFNGQRSNAAAIIPLKHGAFEMQWNQSSPRGKAYPEVCAYGVNLHLQLYLRRGAVPLLPGP